MFQRLITRLEERAAAWLERVVRTAVRRELEADGPEAARNLVEWWNYVAPSPEVLAQETHAEPTTELEPMEAVTFAELANEDTAPAPPTPAPVPPKPTPAPAPAPSPDVPSLTPQQRTDLKWSEHPLGLVPHSWLADRLGIPTAWVKDAADERDLPQLTFANGLRYGHAWHHWLELWGPAKVREWLDVHGTDMDHRRFADALKRGDR